jgi:hypothetical protein
MKLARIFLVSAALISAAACSTDRITAPSAPEAPAAAKSGTSTTTNTSTTLTTSVTDPTTVTCTTSTELINGIATLVTTCNSPYLGGGN